MRHTIQIVEDDQMPPGLDFVLAVLDGDAALITYRASVLCGPPGPAAKMLEDSWAAYRALERELLSI